MGIPAAEIRRAIEGGLARHHRFWVLVCALLVAGSTFLPYLYAYLTTPAGLQFQGILVLPQDLFGYLAKMQQGARGEWLFRLTYTSESHDGAVVFPFYLALGRLSAAIGLAPVLVYHLARLATGVLLLATVFYFALAIFGRADRAWACFAVTALSSGVGWLTSLFGHLPSDLLVPEATTYYAVFANPHFPLGFVLLIAALLAMLKAVERQQMRYALIAGLLTLVQSFVQPFLVITVYAVALVWLTWRWVALKRPVRAEAGYLGALMALPLPGLTYDYAALYLNPVLSQWSAQNVTPSPPLYDYLLGYGLLALLAALGVVYLRRSSLETPMIWAEAGRLLLVWVAVTLVLLYSPFSLQRRMSAGLHVALSFLAVAGFYAYVAPRLKGLLPILLVAMVPTNLFQLLFAVVGAGAYPYPLYLKDGEVAALRWLGQNTATRETALASETSGNIIPALAGNRVFYGHPFETIRAEEKKDLLRKFFADAMSEQEERAFLAAYGVALIYFGRSERELGPFDPEGRGYLWRVFENDDVAIYRVRGTEA